jgi:hypothetical protein
MTSQETHQHPGGNFAEGQETLEHGTPVPGHFGEGQEEVHEANDPGHFSEGQESEHASDAMPGTFADGQRGA